jgi:hypothetical protein
VTQFGVFAVYGYIISILTMSIFCLTHFVPCYNIFEYINLMSQLAIADGILIIIGYYMDQVGING